MRGKYRLLKEKINERNQFRFEEEGVSEKSFQEFDRWDLDL